MELETTLERATGGRQEVGEDWVSGSALRPLIQNDPCLAWLKFHGAANGFEQDPAEYSFLDWIGNKGCQFEAAWVKNVAPEAVQAMEDDKDVRHVAGLKKTLNLMARRVPVIAKAAVWDGTADSRIYGACDLICLTSWLFARFPWLKPSNKVPDHYVVLDCKFTTGLDKSDKKTDLAINSAQVRMYSYALGKMQERMPEYAYLVTRDRVYDPLPVAVDHRLDGPLDPKLAALRDLFVHLKMDGHRYHPLCHGIVVANFNNKKDEPWHNAKKQIIELMPAALEKLPHIGAAQAKGLREFGFECLEDLLCEEGMNFPFEVLAGIGSGTAERIRAVLRANRTGKVTGMTGADLPPLCETELFVDFEFFSNARADFEDDWPTLSGCPMIFMIGVYFKEGGQWQFRQFAAAREHLDAEREMFGEFLTFLHQRGVFDSARSAALYHWSPAEISQSSAASKRHGLERLADLPWVDVRSVFADTPIGVPGAWGYGLKEIAKAVGEYAPEYRSPWPEDLSSGLGAMVMGWRAYEQPQPLESQEIKTLSSYLESDVRGLAAVLSWLRDLSAAKTASAPVRNSRRGGWYSLVSGG